MICAPVRVGVDGRAVRSAKATVPFLARLIGQGVVSGPIRPLIVTNKTPGAPVPHPFEALVVRVKPPGVVGVPEIIPVLGSKSKPAGRELILKLVGLWFAFS